MVLLTSAVVLFSLLYHFILVCALGNCCDFLFPYDISDPFHIYLRIELSPKIAAVALVVVVVVVVNYHHHHPLYKCLTLTVE